MMHTFVRYYIIYTAVLSMLLYAKFLMPAIELGVSMLQVYSSVYNATTHNTAISPVHVYSV